MTVETGHIGINVTDLKRSEDFYSDIFGLCRVDGSDDAAARYAFLGDGHRLVLTLWEQSEGRFDRGTPGLHHLSFRAVSIDQVKEAEARLRKRGAKFTYEGVVPHAEGANSGGIFFEDPDGLRLEIFSDAGAGTASAPTPGAPSCGFF